VAVATVSREPPVIAGLLAEEHQHYQLASSSSASAPEVFTLVRVINDYDSLDEPESGYLRVVKGTIVAVQPGSRAPSDARNRFQCSYVFALELNQSQNQGWIPEDILDSVCVTHVGGGRQSEIG